MIEYEYKKMLTKVQYDFLTGYENMKCYANIKKKFQINYYYDTPLMDFNKEGITIRIRQNDYKLKGTIKEHIQTNGLNKSKEKDFTISRLPGMIRYKGKQTVLKGQLTTDRLIIPIEDKIFLMLDCNYYFGKIDYEMELEFPENKQKIAERYMDKLRNKFYVAKIPLKIHKTENCSKSERFFHEQALHDKSKILRSLEIN